MRCAHKNLATPLDLTINTIVMVCVNHVKQNINKKIISSLNFLFFRFFFCEHKGA